MDYDEARRKFDRLPQSERMKYVALFKAGQTNLVTFMTEYEEKIQGKKQAKQDKKDAIIQKAIEETASEYARNKGEILNQINEQLIDLALEEDWWIRIRQYLESACGSKETQLVVLVLDKVGDQTWQATTYISPSKEKKVILDIGHEKE